MPVKQISLFIICVVAVCALFCANAWAAPKAVYPQIIFNFGAVPGGGTISHAFTVENDGNENLVIQRIVSDCGCATTKSDKIIAPGAKGTITVNFDTRGYQGREVTRTIIVHTNDKTAPSTALEITAFVENPVNVEPARVSFTGRPQENLVSTVTITPSASFPLNIVTAQARFGSNIRYELSQAPQKAANGQTVYLLTVYNTKEEAGRYFDEIILTTDSSAVPEITVKVNGHILGAGQ